MSLGPSSSPPLRGVTLPQFPHLGDGPMKPRTPSLPGRCEDRGSNVAEDVSGKAGPGWTVPDGSMCSQTELHPALSSSLGCHRMVSGVTQYGVICTSNVVLHPAWNSCLESTGCLQMFTTVLLTRVQGRLLFTATPSPTENQRSRNAR